MTHEITGLAASYRRRAWCARLTGAVMAANLMLTLAALERAGWRRFRWLRTRSDKSGKTDTPAKTAWPNQIRREQNRENQSRHQERRYE